jgi:MFS transporter, PAT family, beta-lactamase induction signal transducer AmpG
MANWQSRRGRWRAAYLCMAMMMAPGMIAALLAPESESDKKPRSEHPSFVATVTGPIKELVVRLGPMGIPIRLLVAGFRMPGYISSAMAVPLTIPTRTSRRSQNCSAFGALGGTFLASYVVKRIGLMSSLLAGTVFASASHLSLAYLAVHGDHGGACP